MCRACIISALRLQTLYPSTTSKDPSWDKIPSAIYGIIEVNVGIVCASVVTLRPFYRQLCEAAARGGKGAGGRLSDLDVPGRRVRAGSGDFAIGTGETTKVGSDSNEELEDGMRQGRRNESSVGDKSMSLAKSRTLVSDTVEAGREPR